MSKCNKCEQPIEWKEKKDKSGMYPVNPGKMMGSPDFFHSATCGKKPDPYVDNPKTNPMGGFSMSDAINEAREALKDHSDINWTSEDIQKFAVSIYISRGGR